MNEFNTYEYVVAQKKEGKWRILRILLFCAYILFVICGLVIGLVTKLLVPLLALTPVAVWMLVFFTWRYVNPEYEYSITGGKMTFSVIYGGRSRSEKLEVMLKDMSVIAPYNHEIPETVQKGDGEIDRFSPEKEYVFVSSFSSPDIYYGLFTDNDTNESVIVWFEATEKALKIFKFYNSTATVVSNVRY